MEYIAICAALYTVLIFADILPRLKKKQWKPLRFSIPVYIVTFVINLLIGLDIKIISLDDIIKQAVTFVFKLKQ